MNLAGQIVPVLRLADSYDRRVAERTACRETVSVYEPDAGRLYGAQLRNLSRTGLQLEIGSAVKFKSGDLLHVRISSGSTEMGRTRPGYRVAARVVWVEKDYDAELGIPLEDRRRRAGIVFLGRSSSDDAA